MSSSNDRIKVGFVGFGKMAGSIATGLKRESRWVTAAFDVAPVPGDGTQMFSSVKELEEWSDLLLLCAKPQDMAVAVADLQGARPCLSIAAGLSTTTLRTFFNREVPVIARSMPNLGATVGLSTTAVYCEDPVFRNLCVELFSAVGYAFAVQSEELMHGVTGLSGSGPAYVFLMIQSLAEAGVREGLLFDDALKMAVQTVLAAATLLDRSGEHPEEWIRRVSSPGGTTIAGMAALEEHGMRHSIYEAVRRATERSRQLDQKK